MNFYTILYSIFIYFINILIDINSINLPNIIKLCRNLNFCMIILYYNT